MGKIPSFLDTSNSRTQWVVTLIGLGLLCVLIWLPFGFQRIGLIEEWHIYQSFDQGNLIPTDTSINRIGQIFPFIIANWLIPNTFVGLYIIVAISIFIKGVLLFAIFKRLLPKGQALAFMIAFLWLIYPADVGLFQTRLISFQFVLITFLLAILLMLHWLATPNKLYIVGIWVCQFICLISYEVAFPLIFVAPLLFWWQSNKSIDRKLVTATMLWLIVPVIMLIWTVVLFLTGGIPYQIGIVRVTQPVIPSVIVNIMRLYSQSFATAWWLALTAPLPLVLRVFSVIIGLLAGIITYLQVRPLPPVSSGHLRRWGHSGLVIMFLGFMAFLPSEHHRSISDRVFLLSSLGAAVTLVIVVWSLVLYFPFRYRRAAFSIFAGIFAGWAALWAYQQQVTTIGYVEIETNILTSITTTVPAWSSDRVMIVLFDRTGQMARTEQLFEGNHFSLFFQEALQYVYNSPNVFGALCFSENFAWRAAMEPCEFNSDTFVLHSRDGNNYAYPYSEVVAFEYTGEEMLLLSELTTTDGAPIASYSPQQMIMADAPLPYRYSTLFSR